MTDYIELPADWREQTMNAWAGDASFTSVRMLIESWSVSSPEGGEPTPTSDGPMSDAETLWERLKVAARVIQEFKPETKSLELARFLMDIRSAVDGDMLEDEDTGVLHRFAPGQGRLLTALLSSQPSVPSSPGGPSPVPNLGEGDRPTLREAAVTQDHLVATVSDLLLSAIPNMDQRQKRAALIVHRLAQFGHLRLVRPGWVDENDPWPPVESVGGDSTAPPTPSFGPGWEDVDNGLYADDPERWRPVADVAQAASADEHLVTLVPSLYDDERGIRVESSVNGELEIFLGTEPAMFVFAEPFRDLVSQEAEASLAALPAGSVVPTDTPEEPRSWVYGDPEPKFELDAPVYYGSFTEPRFVESRHWNGRCWMYHAKAPDLCGLQVAEDLLSLSPWPAARQPAVSSSDGEVAPQ